MLKLLLKPPAIEAVRAWQGILVRFLEVRR